MYLHHMHVIFDRHNRKICKKIILFNFSRFNMKYMPYTVVVFSPDICIYIIYISFSHKRLLKFMCITVLRLLRSLVSKNFDYEVSRKNPISFLWKMHGRMSNYKWLVNIWGATCHLFSVLSLDVTMWLLSPLLHLLFLIWRRRRWQWVMWWIMTGLCVSEKGCNKKKKATSLKWDKIHTHHHHYVSNSTKH